MISKILSGKIKIFFLLCLGALLGFTRSDTPSYQDNFKLWQSMSLEEKREIVKNYLQWKKAEEQKRDALEKSWRSLHHRRGYFKKMWGRYSSYRCLSRDERTGLQKRFSRFHHETSRILQSLPKEEQERLSKLPREEQNQVLRKMLWDRMQATRVKILSALPKEIREELKSPGRSQRRAWRQLFTAYKYLGDQWVQKNPEKFASLYKLSREEFYLFIMPWKAEKTFQSIQKLPEDQQKKILQSLQGEYPSLKTLEDLPKFWKGLDDQEKKREFLRSLRKVMPGYRSRSGFGPRSRSGFGPRSRPGFGGPRSHRSRHSRSGSRRSRDRSE